MTQENIRNWRKYKREQLKKKYGYAYAEATATDKFLVLSAIDKFINHGIRYTFKTRDIAPICKVTSQKVAHILPSLIEVGLISIFDYNHKKSARYQVEFGRGELQLILNNFHVKEG